MDGSGGGRKSEGVREGGEREGCIFLQYKLKETNNINRMCTPLSGKCMCRTLKGCPWICVGNIILVIHI